MAVLPAVGIGLQAAGLAGSILGKKKQSSIDLTPYRQAITTGANKQRELIGQQYNELQPLNQQYQTSRNQLSASVEPAYAKIGEDLASRMKGIGAIEQQAANQQLDLNQRIAARNIPLQQQLLRESLASSGQLRTGGAGKVLSQPVQQFQTAQSDLAAQLSAQRTANEASRAENVATQQAELARQGLSQRLGLDTDTIDTLLNLGRTDLIEKYAGLKGVSQDEVNAMLSLLGIQSQQSLANAAAENENRQSLYNALGSLGGTLAGYGLNQPNYRATASSSLFPNQRITY